MKVRDSKITVNVLFFGPVAESVGRRSERVRVQPGASASQLVSEFISARPGFNRRKLLFSVNQEYVSGDVALKDGDEVAIFAAVSGG
ncbi:MAG: MoaD/ThiS family protein [Pyrinomonadaceae bacterium]